MLTITLGTSKEHIETADGKIMTVLSAKIFHDGKDSSLNGSTKLATVDGIEIIVHVKGVRQKLCMPDFLSLGMVIFLNTYHARQDMQFSCYDFANLVNNLPEHRVKYLFPHWDIKSSTELISGTTIFFLNMEKEVFIHAAVYIDSGIFVSVYGAGGDLEFSTLEDMRLDFGGIPVVALPKTAIP